MESVLRAVFHKLRTSSFVNIIKHVIEHVTRITESITKYT